MARGMLCDRFRSPHHHDLAALIDAIGTQINNPVGTTDHLSSGSKGCSAEQRKTQLLATRRRSPLLDK